MVWFGFGGGGGGVEVCDPEAHLLGRGVLLEGSFLDLFSGSGTLEYVVKPLCDLENRRTKETSLALLMGRFHQC